MSLNLQRIAASLNDLLRSESIAIDPVVIEIFYSRLRDRAYNVLITILTDETKFKI